MADQLVIAPFDGYISAIVQGTDGLWTVTIRSASGQLSYITQLYEVYVLPCNQVKLGDKIGKTKGLFGGIASICLNVPEQFTITPEMLTHDGCLTLGWADVPAGYVLAGPVSGVPVKPTFRRLQGSDVGMEILELKFTVGDTGAPQDGDISFYILDDDGNPITGKRFLFIRERDTLFTPRDFTYNQSTGLMTVLVPFDGETGAEEDVVIWMFESSLFVAIGFGGEPAFVDPVVLNDDGDVILLNDSGDYWQV